MRVPKPTRRGCAARRAGREHTALPLARRHRARACQRASCAGSTGFWWEMGRANSAAWGDLRAPMARANRAQMGHTPMRVAQHWPAPTAAVPDISELGPAASLRRARVPAAPRGDYHLLMRRPASVQWAHMAPPRTLRPASCVPLERTTPSRGQCPPNRAYSALLAVEVRLARRPTLRASRAPRARTHWESGTGCARRARGVRLVRSRCRPDAQPVR